MIDPFVEIAEAFYKVPHKPSRRRRREGFVYFAQRGKDGPIKIGWSVDPRKRLSSLRTSSAEDIHLIAVEWTSRVRERELHEKLAAFRITREWYRPAPEVFAEAGIGPLD